MTTDMNASYYKYWGKARKRDDGTYDYHLLVYHCLDVAAVGSELLKMNPTLLPALLEAAVVLKIDVRTMIMLLLSIHDFGKFSPTFQSKIPEVQYQLQGNNRGKPSPVRHDALGLLLWQKYKDHFYVAEDIIKSISITDALTSLVFTSTG